MNTTDSTILITGGGSGIGRGLAEAFHALGSRVVIAGRNEKNLDAVTSAHPGMESRTVDMTDDASIASFAAGIAADFPSLNALVNNAGIARPENLLDRKQPLADAEAMVLTNVLGPLRLTAALLPTLQKQPQATVMNVTSGLAFLPLAMTPTYCATKAALHSYTESLRYQLRGTPVEVLELIPPHVQTELGGAQQASDPRAMPLADFISEVMAILKTDPTPPEINVEKVYPLRFAADHGQGAYQEMFQKFNDAFASGAH